MTSQSNYELLNPETMHRASGYSQLATVLGGSQFFIAGQVALDRQGNLVGKDDPRAQTQQVFENLKAAIEAAGADFSDVLKLNAYFVDLAHGPDFRSVRDKFVNIARPPISTAVQVTRLFRPEFLIEVEAMGAVRSK